MTTPKLPDQKMAKIRFFVFYTISVLLVLILAASFTQGHTPNAEKTAAASSSTGVRIAIDELLHQQMEKLEDVRAAYAGKDTSRVALDAIQTEKASFFAVIDSIRKATASLPDATEKQQIETLLTTFGRSAESGVIVLKNAGTSTRDSSAGVASPTREEMDELKEILAQKEQKIIDLEKSAQGTQGSQAVLQEKDKTITTLQNKVTSLETALAQQPKTMQSQSRTDGGASEWKDKYNKIKESNDQLRATNQKYESQANALKTSYKEVIEDNKRLASQIQALKGGKN